MGTAPQIKEKLLMAPLKPYIYPFQVMLADFVYALRFTSSVLCWESSYLSFWVTFISFVLFLVCLIIPWAFILTWTMRFLVWTLLGPWMKLADLYYFKKYEEISLEAQIALKQEARRMRRESYHGALDHYKIAHEEDIKMRDMKMRICGDYIVSVPHFHLQMLRDIPLPDSSARFIGETDILKGLKPYHIAGQHLVGTMIPLPVDEAIESTADGKEEKENKYDSYSDYVYATKDYVTEIAKNPKDILFKLGLKSDKSE